MKINIGQYTMRLISRSDSALYMHYGFDQASQATKYFTGSTDHFTQEQVTAYVNKTVEDVSRLHYLILDSEVIVGEVVLMDIDRSPAHFRIALFNEAYFSKGIGTLATRALLNIAFVELNIDAIELEVYPFNKAGMALYNRMGFKVTECIKDTEAVSPYIDINVMRLTNTLL